MPTWFFPEAGSPNKIIRAASPGDLSMEDGEEDGADDDVALLHFLGLGCMRLSLARAPTCLRFIGPKPKNRACVEKGQRAALVNTPSEQHPKRK
mmetsp:Transcript_194/g.285  ORF Transcript_194/g.285 Transcript_194/m.285 type:complete len:94 (-) Transcript_194:56-337(-)